MRSKLKITWRTRLFHVIVGMIILVELCLIPIVLFGDSSTAYYYNDKMKAITVPFGFVLLWVFYVGMFTSYQNGPRYFVSVDGNIVNVRAWKWLLLKSEKYDLTLYKSVLIYTCYEKRVPNFFFFKSIIYSDEIIKEYFGEWIRYLGLVGTDGTVEYIFTDEFMDNFTEFTEYIAQQYNGKIEYLKE